MNSHNPLISVIIPAYNHEKYVAATIKSIIAQTYNNVELLVINDGSKDRTWEVIQGLQKKCEQRFSRVVFQTQQNAGTCETLNKLLDLAQGEFIYLIASDDLAKPHALETLHNLLGRNEDYALVVGDNEFIDAQGNRITWSRQNNEDIYSDFEYETFGQFLRLNRWDIDFLSPEFGSYQNLVRGNHVPNGYLIRHSIFNTIGYFTKEAPLEDYYLMLQISKHSKLKYIDEILFSYRWHSKNTALNRLKMLEMTRKTLAHIRMQTETIPQQTTMSQESPLR